MSRNTPADRQLDSDIKVILISRIWAYATGMLAIAMLLTPAHRRSLAIPIAIPSAAAVSTIVIWSVPDRSRRSSADPRLEQRVANLEAIAGSEDLAWQTRLQPEPTTDEHSA